MEIFYVGVPQAQWPTTQSLQSCIEQHCWPLIVGASEEALWTTPFATIHGKLGLSVLLRGEVVELEASIIRLSPSEYFAHDLTPTDTTSLELEMEILGSGKAIIAHRSEFKPLDVNEVLTGLGAENVRFETGDFVLELAFRSSKKEREAGYYIIAALTKCFGGYAFQRQGHRHGGSDLADVLIQETIELHARGSEPMPPPFLKWRKLNK